MEEVLDWIVQHFCHMSIVDGIGRMLEAVETKDANLECVVAFCSCVKVASYAILPTHTGVRV